MKSAIALAVMAALCGVGCKKKNESAGGATGSAAAPATKPSEPAAGKPAVAAGAAKSCEELGGKKEGEDRCVMTSSPFEVTFSGKFDTKSTQPEPGPVFKVTNKSDQPLKVNNANLVIYDKAGTQLEMTFSDGSKSKYAQDSMSGLLELAPGESKDYIHSVGKKLMPAEMDTAQVEITSWSSGDGKMTFARYDVSMDSRPKK